MTPISGVLLYTTRSGRQIKQPDHFTPVHSDDERMSDDYRSDEHDSGYDYTKMQTRRASGKKQQKGGAYVSDDSSSVTSIETSGAGSLMSQMSQLSIGGHSQGGQGQGGQGQGGQGRRGSNSGTNDTYENETDDDADEIYAIMKGGDDNDEIYTPSPEEIQAAKEDEEDDEYEHETESESESESENED